MLRFLYWALTEPLIKSPSFDEYEANHWDLDI